MSDRKMEIKSKLVIKDLDNPKKGAALTHEGEKHLMGTFVGIASKTVSRTMPTGEVYEGLGGDFEGTPTDESRAIVRSGVLYLPGGVHDTIAENLTDGNKISFGFKVYSVKATNAAGYSYAFEPMMAPSEADPLAMLKKEMGEKLQLSAPDAQKEDKPAARPRTTPTEKVA